MVKRLSDFLAIKEDENTKARRQAKKIKHCDDLEDMMFERLNPDGTLYIGIHPHNVISRPRGCTARRK